MVFFRYLYISTSSKDALKIRNKKRFKSEVDIWLLHNSIATLVIKIWKYSVLINSCYPKALSAPPPPSTGPPPPRHTSLQSRK